MELIRSFRLEPNARPDRADLNAEYPVWLARRTPSESDLARLRIEGENLPYRPVISLVVPVYNTAEKYLSLMVDSVMAQTYDQWELCLADDASTDPHVRPFLDRLARHNARVKVDPSVAEPGDFRGLECRLSPGHGGIHRAPRPRRCSGAVGTLRGGPRGLRRSSDRLDLFRRGQGRRHG